MSTKADGTEAARLLAFLAATQPLNVDRIVSKKITKCVRKFFPKYDPDVCGYPECLKGKP